jgi:hypothetical protein
VAPARRQVRAILRLQEGDHRHLALRGGHGVSSGIFCCV